MTRRVYEVEQVIPAVGLAPVHDGRRLSLDGDAPLFLHLQTVKNSLIGRASYWLDGTDILQ